MSINITDKPEVNVVNVGDEISESTLDALTAAASQNPASGNAFLTVNTASSTYQPVGSYLVSSDLAPYLLSSTAASTYQPVGSYAVLNSTNVFSAHQVVSTNTTSTAFRITQVGTGAAFVVEDKANPDDTPFVIDNDGRVGVRTPANQLGTNSLTVSGVIQANPTATSPHAVYKANTTAGDADFNATSSSGRARLLLNGSSESVVYMTGTSSLLQMNSGGARVVVGTSGAKTEILPNGIQFADSTIIESAPTIQFNSSITIDSTNYPDEVQLKIGVYTFRMPARQITP